MATYAGWEMIPTMFFSSYNLHIWDVEFTNQEIYTSLNELQRIVCEIEKRKEVRN